MLANSQVRITQLAAGSHFDRPVDGNLRLVFVVRGQLGWIRPDRPGLLRAGWTWLNCASEAGQADDVRQHCELRVDAESVLIEATIPAVDLMAMAPGEVERGHLVEVLGHRFERLTPLTWEDRSWIGELASHDLPCQARELWMRLRLAEFLLRQLLPAARTEEAKERRLDQARDWIENRLDQPLDQGALAAHLGCSPRSLRRWMREELDLAPTQWQRLLRLQRAAALLAEGWGATEAGLEVGYPNAAHFSNLFKLHYQVPPSQYRQRCRQVG